MMDTMHDRTAIRWTASAHPRFGCSKGIHNDINNTAQTRCYSNITGVFKLALIFCALGRCMPLLHAYHMSIIMSYSL